MSQNKRRLPAVVMLSFVTIAPPLTGNLIAAQAHGAPGAREDARAQAGQRMASSTTSTMTAPSSQTKDVSMTDVMDEAAQLQSSEGQSMSAQAQAAAAAAKDQAAASQKAATSLVGAGETMMTGAVAGLAVSVIGAGATTVGATRNE